MTRIPSANVARPVAMVTSNSPSSNVKAQENIAEAPGAINILMLPA